MKADASTKKQIVISALAFSALCAAPAQAQDAGGYYAGKTINLAVPSGPGGGYDTYARTFARHYSKHIPGKPQIVVQNTPGGGGLVAANNLFNLAQRDGTALAVLASSSFLVAALGEKLAKFDNLKFTPIGNLSEESDTCSVWHRSGIEKTEDLFAKEVIVGSEGIGSNSQTFPLAMNDTLGTKFKIIPGYQGTQLRSAAMERGELHGACGIFVSTLNALFERQLKEGTWRVVLQMGLSRNPHFPDVPNALELAKTPEAKAALTTMFAQLALGRPLYGPPDMPGEQAAALQKAFAATMEDSEYAAEAAKLRLDRRWFGPDRMNAIMREMNGASEPVKARLRKILNIGG
jgi:tripartite-type tricarboxylate transporter receptor subunit TctC